MIPKNKIGKLVLEDDKIFINDVLYYTTTANITIRDFYHGAYGRYFNDWRIDVLEFCCEFCKSGGLIKTVITEYHKGDCYLYLDEKHKHYSEALFIIDNDNFTIRKVAMGYDPKRDRLFSVGHRINMDDIILGHQHILQKEIIAAASYLKYKNRRGKNTGIYSGIKIIEPNTISSSTKIISSNIKKSGFIL